MYGIISLPNQDVRTFTYLKKGIRVQKKTGVTLYYQVIEYIREKIESGEWPAETRIPSEPDLCSQFGVSRATIRQALNGLVQEGLIVKRQGIGTFVAQPALVGDLIRFVIPEKLGSQHSIISINTISPTLSIINRLKLKTDDKVIEIYRIRLFSNSKEPGSLEKTYLPQEIWNGISGYDFTQPIYKMIKERYHYEMNHLLSEVRPIAINDDEALYLQLPSQTLALLLYRTWLEKDKPIMFTKIIFPADKCRYLSIS